jgi:prepilin-type N-terminal cleavage/methylation domain-containing protein
VVSARAARRGFTLIEFALVMSIATLIFAALSSLVSLGLQAQAAGTSANEQVYVAGFALERIVSRARAAPLKPLSGTPVDSTGDWLGPVMFCRPAGVQRLMETTVTDTTCASGTVLADGVTAFTAQLAPTTRPIDTPVITVSLTVVSPGTPQPVTVSSSVRLGGGTL